MQLAVLQKQFCIQHERTYAENKHYQQKWHKEQYEPYRGVNEVVWKKVDKNKWGLITN